MSIVFIVLERRLLLWGKALHLYAGTQGVHIITIGVHTTVCME